MAHVTITIETDNEAFGDTVGDTAREIARILSDLSNRIEDRDYEFVFDEQPISLRDHNGNRVGKASYHNNPES